MADMMIEALKKRRMKNMDKDISKYSSADQDAVTADSVGLGAANGDPMMSEEEQSNMFNKENERLGLAPDGDVDMSNDASVDEHNTEDEAPDMSEVKVLAGPGQGDTELTPDEMEEIHGMFQGRGKLGSKIASLIQDKINMKKM